MVESPDIKQGVILPIIVGAVIILDHATKVAASIHLRYPQQLIPGALSLTYITNTGASFGILRDNNTLLMVMSTVIILGLCVYYRKNAATLPAVPYSLIVGGATSNLLDRIINGFVVDFISVSFWPAFNVADSAITIGAAWIIINELRKEKMTST